MNGKLSWDDAQTFLAVAEAQSFSAAARQLGVGQPTVSRRIQALESRLEEQLFQRGKHGALPTDAARRLLPAAEQMARWAGEFGRAARGGEQRASGVVRIAAPPGIAVEQLAPFAARLNASLPDLRLEVLAAVDHVDLTRGVADVAIRTRYPRGPELVALHRGSNVPGVFAAPGYAATLVQPCTWRDIAWVSWSQAYRQVAPRPMLERLVENFTPVFSSDDYLVQKAAVRSGLGAMIMGRPVGFEPADLVEIDVGVTLPAAHFYIVTARSMQRVPRVRAVVDALVSSLADRAATAG